MACSEGDGLFGFFLFCWFSQKLRAFPQKGRGLRSRAHKSACNTLMLLMVLIIHTLGVSFMIINPPSVTAWSNGGFSTDPQNPNYGTHDWIAQHALDWLPNEEKQYILDNLVAYLYGTELPDNSIAPEGIGDVAWHHVYFNQSEIMTDDWAAFRASWEFERALFFLNSGDFANASKTAGIMSHYIADVTVFGHVMAASTPWGAETHHSDYESYVNTKTSSYNAEFNSFLSYDGELTLISAYNATKNLAFDTTFDTNGNLTCVWMDQNYNWSDPTFRNRAGESLNLAVNNLADVLHTLCVKSTLGGEEITIFPAADVGLLFENITKEGTTAVEKPLTGPEPPTECFVKKYYDIETTANYSNKIDVKIIYDIDDETGVGRTVSPEEEKSLQLMQWNETALRWENITSYIDTKNNLIIGNASHLSMFGITCLRERWKYNFTLNVDTRMFNISIETNSTISNMVFNQTNKSISFDVAGASGAVGFCNVTIPSELMSCDNRDQWTVKVEGSLVDNRIVMEDANYTYIYFTCTHSAKTVQIQSTHAVPEFPSAFAITLILVTTLFAAILLAKKRNQKPKVDSPSGTSP